MWLLTPQPNSYCEYKHRVSQLWWATVTCPLRSRLFGTHTSACDQMTSAAEKEKHTRTRAARTRMHGPLAGAMLGSPQHRATITSNPPLPPPTLIPLPECMHACMLWTRASPACTATAAAAHVPLLKSQLHRHGGPIPPPIGHSPPLPVPPASAATGPSAGAAWVRSLHTHAADTPRYGRGTAHECMLQQRPRRCGTRAAAAGQAPLKARQLQQRGYWSGATAGASIKSCSRSSRPSIGPSTGPSIAASAGPSARSSVSMSSFQSNSDKSM